MSVWKKIKKPDEELNRPDNVVTTAFEGLRDYSDNKVKMILQKVGYFPEEVQYAAPISDSLSKTTSAFAQIANRLPHPDFGYNPVYSNKALRFRVLLAPTNTKEYEYELFKFKYPIEFYPVTVYAEKTKFSKLPPELRSTDKTLQIANEVTFRKIVDSIILSDITIKLIARLASLIN